MPVVATRRIFSRIHGKDAGDFRRAHHTSPKSFLEQLDICSRDIGRRRLLWLRPAFTGRIVHADECTPIGITNSEHLVLSNLIQPADALIIDDEETAAMICSADCPSVVLHETGTTKWALIHAGCKSLYPENGVSLLTKVLELEFATAKHIEAFAGFGIGPCCYGIEGCIADGNLAEAPINPHHASKGPRKGQVSINLMASIASQLSMRSGIHFRTETTCTACLGRRGDSDATGMYWSHAWDSALLESDDRPGEELVGRNACVFWIG